MTNNPRKLDGLRQLGVDVVDRIPLVMTPNAYNGRYLATKAAKSGHLLDEATDEQAEPLGMAEEIGTGDAIGALDGP